MVTVSIESQTHVADTVVDAPREALGEAERFTKRGLVRCLAVAIVAVVTEDRELAQDALMEAQARLRSIAPGWEGDAR